MTRQAAALIIIAALLVFAFAWAVAGQERARRRNFRKRSDATFGKIPDAKLQPGDFSHVRAYSDSSGAGDGYIDDITWNDCDMDSIFRRVNRTMSAPGEEVLYSWMRHPAMNREELDRRAELKKFFSENPKMRREVEEALLDAGRVRKGGLFESLMKIQTAGQSSTALYILSGTLTAVSIVLLFIFPVPAVIILIVSMLLGAMLQLKARNDEDSCLSGIAAVSSMIRAAHRLSDINAEENDGAERFREIQKKLKEGCRELGGFRRGSSFVTSAAGVGTGIGDLIIQYINLFFHVDVIRYNGMLREVREHRDAVMNLHDGIGVLDAAIAAASFEKSLPYSCCLGDINSGNEGQGTFKEGVSEPESSEDAGKNECRRRADISAVNVFHPLIHDPVPNSISAEKGILLTGSNASGKSTFLKTMAICQILGQALDTVPAKSFRAPFFRIYSSMALKDNLSGGESYFVVEIRSLLRICRASEKTGQGSYPVLGFIDEVLRGTNTIERISASSEILASLDRPDTLVFAATHDTELTQMLDKHFINMHFGEKVEGGDVIFDYKLKDGRADSRNAIRLLSVSGYDPEVVKKADEAAKRFEKTGEWKL